MRKDTAKQALREIVRENGIGICREPDRLESALRGACGDDTGYPVFVLLLALRADLVGKLLKTADGAAYEQIEARLASELFEQFGLDSDVAAWGIESWASALGVITEKPPIPAASTSAEMMRHRAARNKGHRRNKGRHRPAFGAYDQAFSIGNWTIVFPKTDTDVYLWYGDDGASALEIVGSSNGWWHWRHHGTEYVVWSDGTISEQAFFSRPWEMPTDGVVLPAPEGAEFSIAESEGSTTFRIENGNLIITLTDGGEITVPGMSRDLTFRTDTRTVYLPQAVFNEAQNRVFRLGDWFLLWPSGDIDFYLWHGANAETALEIIGDSNGWWRYRHDGEDFVVYSSAITARQTFKRKPWETAISDDAALVPADFQIRVDGLHGTTQISFDDGKLIVKLTDGTELALAPDSAAIQLLSSNGREIELPAALDEPAPDIPRDRVFSIGQWRLVWPSSGNDVYLWQGDTGEQAIEIIGDSNGWWRYRHDSNDCVVWSNGDTTPQSFYDTPWQAAALSDQPPQTPERTFYFLVPGTQGVTTFHLDGDCVMVRLTDGGMIEVPVFGGAVRYTSPRTGSTVQLPVDSTTENFANTYAEPETGDAWAIPLPEPRHHHRPNHTAIALDTPYRFGNWRLMWPSDDNDLYLWYGADAKYAIEVIGDSNGWWRWRADSQERVVWSSGHTSQQDFFDRPWHDIDTQAQHLAPAIAASLSFSIKGTNGLTRFDFEHDELVITLTDGGRIGVRATDPQIDFISPRSQRAVKLPSAAPGHHRRSEPTRPIRPERVYRFGEWRLWRTSTDDGIFVWFGDGSNVAAQFVTDSNGWWRLRQRKTESVVWSDGTTSEHPEQLFPKGPWETTHSQRPSDLPLGTRIRLDGPSGTTEFAFDATGATVTLSDGGRVKFRPTDPAVEFHMRYGNRLVTFDIGAAPPQPGQIYRFGGWCIFQPSNTADAYLWFGTAADTAIELIGNSTGWWNYRHDGQEFRIWSIGTSKLQPFFAHPWQHPIVTNTTPTAEPVVLPRTAEWRLQGHSGPTVFAVSDGKLRITLGNGGRLILEPDSAHVAFSPANHSPRRLPIEFPEALFPLEIGQVFSVGGWSIFAPTADTPDIYLWFGETPVAAAVECLGTHTVRMSIDNEELALDLAAGRLVPEAFQRRPWEWPRRRPAILAGPGLAWTWPRSGVRLEVVADVIVLTLPTGAQLHLPVAQPTLTVSLGETRFELPAELGRWRLADGADNPVV